MPPSISAPRRSALIVAFAAIYVIWGSTYLAMRVAVETMPPFLMAGGRFLLAGALLWTFLRLRGVPAPTWAQWRGNLFIGAFLLLGGNGLVAWAEKTVPSGLTALLIGVQPLFFVLTEWAWPGGARPRWLTLGALLLGFGGVAWLAAPWENTGQGGLDLFGTILILLACVSWAFGSIYSRYARHGAEPLMAAALQMICGGGLLLLAAGLHGDFAQAHPAAFTRDSWFAFAYLVGMGSLVAFSTYVWLIKHATPASVSTYAFVNPVVAVFLGWLLLGEPITHRTLVASIVIVASVVIITVQKNRTTKSKD